MTNALIEVEDPKVARLLRQQKALADFGVYALRQN